MLERSAAYSGEREHLFWLNVNTLFLNASPAKVCTPGVHVQSRNRVVTSKMEGARGEGLNGFPVGDQGYRPKALLHLISVNISYTLIITDEALS
jgi:hypothetical protein